MYNYIFTLADGTRDGVKGNNIRQVLANYLQWRAATILQGNPLVKIEIRGGQNSTFTVDKSIVERIIEGLRAQNPDLIPQKMSIQELKCQEMQEKCPDDSKDSDPLLYEDWCDPEGDDVPWKEFVKNDKYLSQCYRLSNILSSFVTGLEAAKNDAPYPQWPRDPFTRIPLSPERLQELYQQAKDAEIQVPTPFTKFMEGLDKGVYDIDAAMASPEINGHANIKHVQGFIEPAVEVLYSKATQSQEDLDFALALQLQEHL